MSLTPLDNFYEQQSEPLKSCYIALRSIILAQSNLITTSYKYNVPFFSVNNKILCYLNFHKKLKQPYIGLVDGHKLHEPYLIAENRVRIKIMLINPNEDLPITNIEQVIIKAVNLKIKPTT